jgi:mRNA interferase MazF
MARRVARGDVWLHRFDAPDKRRPVVVLSRPEAIEYMHSVIVAPVTSRIRGLPSEVRLDVAHGMKGPCVVNLDHVQTVRQSDLRRFVASLPPEVMAQVCRALAVATGCS